MDKRKVSPGAGRRPYRVGGAGAFSGPPWLFSPQSDLQTRFMAAAFELEPELERSLRLAYDGEFGEQLLQLRKTTAVGFFPAALQVACNGLRSWRERWGLSDKWCLQWVLDKKVYPWASPDQEGQRDSAILGIELRCIKVPLDGVPLRLEIEGWIVTEETRSEFETKAHERFNENLRNYSEEREAEAKEGKYVRTLERRNPDHFYWLAGYQVCRWSASKIADALDEPGSGSTESYSSPPSNEERPMRRGVEQKIRELAKTIGLKLRNSREYDRAQTVEHIRAALKARSRPA
jgi:hypothetical protein